MQSVPSSTSDEAVKIEVGGQAHISDYSSLFGEEYKVLEGCSDATCLNLLDISSIEEGLLHVLYSSASQVRLRPVWLCCCLCTYTCLFVLYWLYNYFSLLSTFMNKASPLLDIG